MPGGKRRLPGRFTAGLIVDSGSVANRMKAIFAGSVLVNSPSFGAGSAASRTAVAGISVTGLNASMLLVAVPASMPGACVTLLSACAVTDGIDTVWGYLPGGAAAAGCAITLNYIAIQT